MTDDLVRDERWAAFVAPGPASDAADRQAAEDVAAHGFVMALTRVWAHQPDLLDGVLGLASRSASAAGLTFRERAVLVLAAARARRDPCCALAWGDRLATAASPEHAVAALTGDPTPFDARERALLAWAPCVAADPSSSAAADVGALRDAGFDDAAIVAATTFVALRVAFASVNGALGIAPDAALVAAAPRQVRDAVTWGRGRS